MRSRILIGLLTVALGAQACSRKVDLPHMTLEVALANPSGVPIAEQEVIAYRPSPCLQGLVDSIPSQPQSDGSGKAVATLTGEDGRAVLEFPAANVRCGFPLGSPKTWLVDEQSQLVSGTHVVFLLLQPSPSTAYQLVYQGDGEELVLLSPLSSERPDPIERFETDWRVEAHSVHVNAHVVL